MEIASRTDVGCVRQLNEDSVLVVPERNGVITAIVADGMGGHQAGEIASQLTIEQIKEQLQSVDAATSVEGCEEAVKHAILAANDAVYRQASSNENYKGMGTTAVVVVASAERLTIGHIGDSRAYLLRADKQELVQLTEDHSLVNELVKNGSITPEEAAVHPRRNVLLRALGTEAIVQVDVASYEWKANDVVLICSDGLSGMINDELIERKLLEPLALADQVDQLVQAALDAGGDDNVTVILLSNKPHHGEEKGGDAGDRSIVG